jgi:hypothetical protein
MDKSCNFAIWRNSRVHHSRHPEFSLNLLFRHPKPNLLPPKHTTGVKDGLDKPILAKISVNEGFIPFILRLI